MDVGVILPQTEIGSDPDQLAEFARTVDRLGYEHLLAYDHVLGANADREGGWDGPYDHTDAFHEPLTTFSHFAALTDDVALVTGVLVLPQRQTALVAKQATQVDILSGGRLRLGVGVGWNHLEYVALDESFERRGRRIEEQVELLRALWSRELVEFDGEFHEIPDGGLNPRPERAIPVWMGGSASPVLRRIARTADGWLPQFCLGEADAELARLREHCEAVGRDPDDVAIHARMRLPPDEDEWVDRLAAWADVGPDYLAVKTMERGLSPAEHVETVERFAERVRDAGFDLS